MKDGTRYEPSVIVEKEARERCPKLDGNDACTVYEQRPKTCREYTCLWLDGAMGDQDRPDVAGFVLHETVHPKGGPLIAATETIPGALAEGSQAWKDLLRLGARFPIFVARTDESKAALQPAGHLISPLVLNAPAK